MADGVIPYLAMLVFSLLVDAAARPRALRTGHGVVLHLLAMTVGFGVLLAGTGNAIIAALVATAFAALLMVASNAKRKMLGEPLVFSDLALVVGIVRHPRFYFSALSAAQRWMLGIGAIAAVIAIVLLSSSQVGPHLTGGAVALAAIAVLALALRSKWYRAVATTPELDADFQRYGLLACLLLYWWRWRGSMDPAPCPTVRAIGDGTADAQPVLIVIVQCESFCDPAEITGALHGALPGLDAARGAAWQWGTLDVSGFGAYTMRTEYGVLFGRSEESLGFRRYDPFLTAAGEASYALSSRLQGAGYRSLFVHPHDLRFYSRDRLMPSVGFDAMIGEEGFTERRGDGGRYVDDRTLGAAVIGLIEQATVPSMIYTVTMENHGPWDSDTARDAAGRRDAYIAHLGSSDAMLRDLVAHLAQDGRPALLVFFGDHRPSIPGVTAPGGARHTPYVMLRFGPGGVILRKPGQAESAAPIAVTPAELHHAILHCVTTSRESSGVSAPAA